MFEDSLLVESQTASISATKQWTTIGSVLIQSAIATLLVVLPLLHPKHLPLHFEPPCLLAPIPPRPVVSIRAAAAPSNTSAAALPVTSPTVSLISILRGHNSIQGPEPQPSASMGGMDSGAALPDALTTTGRTTAVAVTPTRPAKPLPISSGISAGMLLIPIRPIYPAIARAAHIEGTVIVEATISRAGTIESLHVISGPALLRQAALEAIQPARYQPYRLNGEPVDVQTTITVNFRLGS